jgi:hypothetical protein
MLMAALEIRPAADAVEAAQDGFYGWGILLRFR